MSQRIELSIEGQGNDGEVLIVDNWPNFKTVPMPHGKTIVRREIVAQPQHFTKTEIVPMGGMGYYLLWLVLLTAAIGYLLYRDSER